MRISFTAKTAKNQMQPLTKVRKHQPDSIIDTNYEQFNVNLKREMQHQDHQNIGQVNINMLFIVQFVFHLILHDKQT